MRYDHYRLNAKPDQTFWNTVGSGYQVRDYREGQLSWRLGALYDIGDSHTLYANYAEGFRAPAFNETNLGFENASQGYSYIANPGLKPEKSRGIEIGWRSDNGILKHDLSAYYTTSSKARPISAATRKAGSSPSAASTCQAPKSTALNLPANWTSARSTRHSTA